MKKEDADQLIRCVKECWWRVLLLLTIPLSLAAWAMYGWPIVFNVKEGAAAWVQAVGAVGALLVALYVMNASQNYLRAQQKETNKNKIVMVLNAASAIGRLGVQLHRDRARCLGVITSRTDYRPLFEEWSRALRMIDLMDEALIEIAPHILQISISSDQFLNIEKAFFESRLQDSQANRDMRNILILLEKSIRVIELFFHGKYDPEKPNILVDEFLEINCYYRAFDFHKKTGLLFLWD